MSPPDLEFGEDDEFIRQVNDETLEVYSQRETKIEKLQSEDSDLKQSRYSPVPNRKSTPVLKSSTAKRRNSLMEHITGPSPRNILAALSQEKDVN